VSAAQRQTCAARILNPTRRDRFERMLRQADALILEAARLRRFAWSEYYASTGLQKRGKKEAGSPYA
jgi:hypothetical protein